MAEKEASYYLFLDDNKVRCMLCPHLCTINRGNSGICKVRYNNNGKLFTRIYNIVSAINIDPIEKKPLYHFYPGSKILSIGTIGCNLQCQFCQNSDISQVTENEFPFLKPYIINDLVKIAVNEKNNIGIAYTYNEPVVWFEFMLDIAKEAKKNNLLNVVVSNGYIMPQPLDELIPYIDAFNIDLKSFSEDFMKKYTHSTLKPVLDNLVKIKNNTKHLEITNLVIPTLNDNEAEFAGMVKWISENLGNDVPLHISRYFPRYKLYIDETPIETLERFYNIAQGFLKYVYIGNASIGNSNNTICNKCGNIIIERRGYYVFIKGLDIKGRCTSCGEKIIDYFIVPDRGQEF
jgi:pyruvate formate lyase activating enzyme